MDASSGAVVLSPQLGRRWWSLVAVLSVLYVAGIVFLAVRAKAWLLLAILLVLVMFVASLLAVTRRRLRVTLADGVLSRPMGRVRIPASEIVDVSTAPGAMLRRAVVVTTRTGDLVPIGLDGPDPHHAVEAARTIRQWAERNGADFAKVSVGPTPVGNGTLLRPARQTMVVVVAMLAATWIGFAIRAASTHPPMWVVVCGVLGSVPALVSLPRLHRERVQVEGDTLVVTNFRRVVHVAARDVAGVDLDSNQYVRVLRTNGRPVSLMVRGRSAAGLPGRMLAWAQAHGGGVGEPLTTAERVDWPWSLGYGAVVALLLTPVFWALSPQDPERYYFMVLAGMAGALLGPLLNGRRHQDRGARD